jgi:hypothetical protein
MASQPVTRTALSRNQALSGFDRVVLSLICLVTGVAALASLPAAAAMPGRPVAILFPPWISEQEAVTRSLVAGHRVLRPGRSSFVVIVAPADATSAAKPQGAVLMLTLAGLAGCLDVALAEENPS